MKHLLENLAKITTKLGIRFDRHVSNSNNITEFHFHKQVNFISENFKKDKNRTYSKRQISKSV